jgi:hypothetical protein
LTTTSRIPSGAVQIARTSVIRIAGIPPDGCQAGGTTGSGHCRRSESAINIPFAVAMDTENRDRIACV